MSDNTFPPTGYVGPILGFPRRRLHHLVLMLHIHACIVINTLHFLRGPLDHLLGRLTCQDNLMSFSYTSLDHVCKMIMMLTEHQLRSLFTHEPGLCLRPLTMVEQYLFLFAPLGLLFGPLPFIG